MITAVTLLGTISGLLLCEIYQTIYAGVAIWISTLVVATNLYFWGLALQHMTELVLQNQEIMQKGIKISAPSEDED